ncbi:MAG: transposase [Roseiflexaceae bacterium]|nr:transposase [Roseiflexaceae bacterium]
MPQHAFISIPLDMPDVRVTKTAGTKTGDFILTAERRLPRPSGRRCRQTTSTRPGDDAPRDLRHLPIVGRPVSLRLRPKRFRCPYGAGNPTTTPVLDGYDAPALHPKAYAHQRFVPLVNSTIADVASTEEVRYAALLGMLDRGSAPAVDGTTVGACTTSGRDELALRKGHRNVVAIMTAQTPTGQLQVLAVVPDRVKPTVSSWLATLPTPIRDRMTTVCTARWDGDVSAVREVLPAASSGIDRFHVAGP